MTENQPKQKFFAEIICGDTAYRSNEVVLVRDRDVTLEKMFRGEPVAADTLIVKLCTEEDIIRMNDKIASGYQYLQLRLENGRATYPVKREHLGIAERLTEDVYDEQTRKNAPSTIN